MGKKLPYTTNTTIRAALRRLWLRSRERAAALKREHSTCQGCGRKASTAKGREFKVAVHHKKGIDNWDELIKAIRKYLLVNPDDLEVLCPDCHKKEHER